MVLLWIEMHYWHCVEHHCWVLVCYYGIFSAPSGTIHEETTDVDTVRWSFFNVFRLFSFQEFECENEFINSNPILSGVGLQHTCHEALWEEHSW